MSIIKDKVDGNSSADLTEYAFITVTLSAVMKLWLKNTVILSNNIGKARMFAQFAETFGLCKQIYFFSENKIL